MLIEFVEVYVVFHQVDSLGGFDFAEVAVMYGLSAVGFGMADMVVGHVDRLPFYVRTGTFDAFLLRPLSALGQLVTSDFSLRRLGRIGSGVVVLVIALAAADIDWTPARALLVVVTPVAGGIIFGAVFVATCTIGFHVVEGMEFANALTYGGNYLSSFPFTIFGTFIRRFFTFVVPGSLRRLPADPRPARSLRPGRAAHLALVERTARLAPRRGRGLVDLAARTSPLRGGGLVIIEVTDLRREFVVRRRAGRLRRTRDVVAAVDGVTFGIAPGECVGYIGANGAGKSTTIKMLTGILVPTSGTVRVCGLEPVRERTTLARRIGVVFGQRSQLWWDLPLRESFRLLGAIHRLPTSAWQPRLAECVQLLEMEPFLDTPVRQLSLGQRMRGEVTAALLHSPELLVLDEPTIGLDLLSKERLRAFLVRERAERGTTVLLTTHDLPDIERLCDRILVVDHGRVAFDGDLPGLVARVGAERVLVVDLAEPGPPLTDVPGTTLRAVEADGLRQHLAFRKEDTTAAAVVAAVSARVELRDLAVHEPAIEDVVRRLYLE